MTPLSPALVADIRAYLRDRVDYDFEDGWPGNNEANLLASIRLFGPDALPDVLAYFAGREDDEGRRIYQRMKEESA